MLLPEGTVCFVVEDGGNPGLDYLSSSWKELYVSSLLNESLEFAFYGISLVNKGYTVELPVLISWNDYLTVDHFYCRISDS